MTIPSQFAENCYIQNKFKLKPKMIIGKNATEIKIEKNLKIFDAVRARTERVGTSIIGNARS